MNEKVKLTQEQADAIELHNKSNDSGSDGILNKHARNYRSFVSENWGYPYEALNDLEISKLAKALYIGYEVQPEFKVGDWVVVRFEGEDWVTDLTRQNEFGGFYTDSRLPGEKQKFYRVSILRHATPEEIAQEKQRRWWAKHNRDVWELKEKDELYSMTSSCRYDVVHVFKDGSVNLEIVSPNVFNQKGVNTVTKRDLNTDYFSIVCLAEDRKDV